MVKSTMYSIEELTVLKEKIVQNLDEVIFALNRKNNLDDLLVFFKLGSSTLQICDEGNKKKILVLGESMVANNVLYAIAEKYGISKNRLCLKTNYEDVKKYDTSKLKWSGEYAVVFFGAQPHKGKNIKDNSSIVSYVETEVGMPKALRLGTKGLKITKYSFSMAIETALKDKMLEPDF